MRFLRIANLFPVAVSDARITDGSQQWHVVLEFVNLRLESLRNHSRSGRVAQHLDELVHCPPHLVNLVLNIFGLQRQERTLEKTHAKI